VVNIAIVERQNKNGTRVYYAVVRQNSKSVWLNCGSSRMLAKERHDEYAVQGRRGQIPTRRDMTFQRLSEDYFAHGCPDLREQTIRSYKCKAKNHLLPFFGDERVRRNITTERIQIWIRWCSDRGVSATSIRAAFTVLSAILSCAVNTNLIHDNPCRKVRLPKVERGGVDTILSPAQISRLISHTPNRGGDRVLMQFLAMTAVRPSEASEARWRDVSWANATVAISRTAISTTSTASNPTKTGKARIIPIAPSLLAALSGWKQERYGGEDDLIFPSIRGGRRDMMRYARDVLRPALTRAGLGSEIPEGSRSLYLLRKSSGSAMLASGVAPNLVAEILGHDVTTLLKYYAVTRAEDGQNAIKMLDSCINTIEVDQAERSCG